ncbi:MAG: type II secretion system protein GspE, partial [Bdellovibrionales bacterium]|nr:type II secretion system protein GspE [Bdellovibrionales bacterium]
EVGMKPEDASRAKLFRGKGCKHCGDSGYRGRMAIYEVFDFSMSLKELVLRGATSIEIRRQAIQEGMRSLRESALAKVADGSTSLEEAMSLTLEN